MKRLLLMVPLALLWVMTAVVPEAEAYNQWSTNRTDNCAGCHGGYLAAPYISNKDGTNWGTDLMGGHLSFIDTGCSTCHGSGGRFPVQTGSSAGGTGLDPIGCVGCHGRDENGDVTAAGLRQHHFNAGVTLCTACHTDSNPANFTTVAESVMPPYYGIGSLPSNACNEPTGSEAKFGPSGLDNDGNFDEDIQGNPNATPPRNPDTACVALPPQDIAVAPTTLDFGVVFIGDSSLPQNVTISNVGGSDLSVSGIVLGAGTSAEFTFTATPTPFVIPAGGSETVQVTYAPVDVGADVGTLEIASDDPDTPAVSVALSGTGAMAPMPDINLNPVALDFGTVFIGSASTSTASIENLGNADLTVTAIALCAGTSNEFGFTNPAPVTIPAGGAQSISVTYTPVDVGADAGCLDISSNDPDEAIAQLALDGIGAAVPVPDINLDPVALDFGSVTVGTALTLSTSIQNLGNADLTVTGIAPSAGTSAEFSFSAPATPFTVSAGGTQAVSVTYTPVDVGTDTGSLEVASNDPDEPSVLLDLTGTGAVVPTPDINLVPVALDFGVVTVGSASTLTSQVENLGTANLTVTAVDLCAGTSTEFGFAPLALTTIPPGGSETLPVTYTPADAGTDTGCIAIASNDPDEATVELGLAGTGEVLAPVIGLAPTSLDFGVVTIGDTATQTATISNDGSAPLTVDSIAPFPGTSAEFSFTAPATPFTLAVGGSQAVSVTYAPLDIGLDTGSLEIISDDPASPVIELALSGSGEEPVMLVPDIALDPTSLDFGSVVIGNVRTLSAAIRNLGNGDLSVEMIDLCPGTSMEYSFMSDATPFVVPPGGSRAVPVTYTPADLGDDVGCLAIDSNDPDEPMVELGLTGTGIEPPTGVEVAIKVPGAINLGNRGITPVKFWTDMMDLDFAYVVCGPDMAEPKRLNMEDFNEDGYMDVVGLFRTRDLGIECGDETLMCQGTIAGGTSFTGTSNTFKTVGRGCKSKPMSKYDDDDDDHDRNRDDDDHDRDRDDDDDHDGDRDGYRTSFRWGD